MPIAGSNQVQNLKEKGPVAYSFPTRPELGSPVSDKQAIEDLDIDVLRHKVYFLPSSLEQLLSVSVFVYQFFAIQHLGGRANFRVLFRGLMCMNFMFPAVHILVK